MKHSSTFILLVIAQEYGELYTVQIVIKLLMQARRKNIVLWKRAKTSVKGELGEFQIYIRKIPLH